MSENNNGARIDVRFEDYNGVVFRHFCPYCMEEIEKTITYEEPSVECEHCKKILNLNWSSYVSDMENFLSEKIRYAVKSANAYDDDEAFCEALAEVIEEIYNADSSESYEVAREVLEFTRGYEDEHDIASQIIELLDVPSFSSSYEDYYNEDEYDEEDDSYDDGDDEEY